MAKNNSIQKTRKGERSLKIGAALAARSAKPKKSAKIVFLRRPRPSASGLHW